MKMIEFSTQKVAGNVKEIAALLSLLLAFALLASGYVFYKGILEGKRSKYSLLLRCIQILTSVVPAELPMQTGGLLGHTQSHNHTQPYTVIHSHTQPYTHHCSYLSCGESQGWLSTRPSWVCCALTFIALSPTVSLWRVLREKWSVCVFVCVCVCVCV